MNRVLSVSLVASVLLVGVTPLTPTFAHAQSSTPAPAADALPLGVALTVPPADAISPASARSTAKAGDRVTLRGRIALGKDAFSGGKGTFTIEDITPPTAPAGDKVQPSRERVAESRAIVRLVDAKGASMSIDVRNRGGLRPGAEVYVVGKVQAMNPGKPMEIGAEGVHVVPPALPSTLFVSAEPAGALAVDQAKAKSPKVGDEVVVRGRIGGSADPFVDSRAVFTIVSTAVKACSDIEGDNCAMPWDYCCEPRKELAKHTATIRVVDPAGEPIRVAIKGQGELKELSEVIVKGKVAQTNKGVLVVDAASIHRVVAAK